MSTCDKCKHSVSVGIHKEGNIMLAECRRFPPMVTIIPTEKGPQKVTMFPQVSAAIGCGEFAIAILTS